MALLNRAITYYMTILSHSNLGNPQNFALQWVYHFPHRIHSYLSLPEPVISIVIGSAIFARLTSVTNRLHLAKALIHSTFTNFTVNRHWHTSPIWPEVKNHWGSRRPQKSILVFPNLVKSTNFRCHIPSCPGWKANCISEYKLGLKLNFGLNETLSVSCCCDRYVWIYYSGDSHCADVLHPGVSTVHQSAGPSRGPIWCIRTDASELADYPRHRRCELSNCTIFCIPDFELCSFL